LLLQAWEPASPTPPQPHVTVDSFSDHRQALSWFTTEHQVLLALVRQAADTGFPGYSQQLALTFAEYLYRQGHWHDWAQTLQTALDSATANAEHIAQAKLHRGLVRAYARQGHVNAAAVHGRFAMELSRQLGDKGGLASTHRVLGVLCEVEG